MISEKVRERFVKMQIRLFGNSAFGVNNACNSDNEHSSDLPPESRGSETGNADGDE